MKSNYARHRVIWVWARSTVPFVCAVTLFLFVAPFASKAGDRAYYIVFVEIDPPGDPEPPPGIADQFLIELLQCGSTLLETCRREHDVQVVENSDTSTSGTVALISPPTSINQELIGRLLRGDRTAQRDFAGHLDSIAIDGVITLEYTDRGVAVASAFLPNGRRVARVRRRLVDAGLTNRDIAAMVRATMRPIEARFVP